MRHDQTALVFIFVVALVVLLQPQPSHAAPGDLQGTIPAGGGIAPVIWGGGPVDQLVTAASAKGCTATSVWAFVNGRAIGSIVGAPSFVSAAFAAEFPGEVPAGTILILLCSPTGSSASPPTVTGTPPGSTTGTANEVEVTTVAGYGPPDVGDTGSATEARLETPWDVAVAPDGTLYVSDTDGYRVRRVGPDRTIDTVAGTGAGEAGAGMIRDGVPATSHSLRQPHGLALAPSGDLYVADTKNYVVRRVDPDGLIWSAAGHGGLNGAPGGPDDPCPDRGSATAACLGHPLAVALDGDGNLYVADFVRRAVLRVDPSGIITTLAGTGTQVEGCSGTNGPAKEARLTNPQWITYDGTGGLLISDTACGVVQRVDLATGLMTTVDGLLPGPTAVEHDGTIDVVTGDRVWRFDPATGAQTLLAGSGAHGFGGDGGPALAAAFSSPMGIAVDGAGNVFVADTGNHRVRRIDVRGVITTVAGSDIAAPEASAPAGETAVYDSRAIAVAASGDVYYGDFLHRLVYRRSPEGVVSVVRELDGPPQGFAVGADGSLYLLNLNGCPVLCGVFRLTPGANGLVDGGADEQLLPVAGVTNRGKFGAFGGAHVFDDMPARDLALEMPREIALDPGGNLLLSDIGPSHERIYRVLPGPDGAFGTGDDDTIQVVAGNGQPVHAGDGGPAREASLAAPFFVAADPEGNAYALEVMGNYPVRRVDATTGAIETYTNARGQYDFAVDACGGVYFAAGTAVVRYDPVTSSTLTIAGSDEPGFADGVGTIARFRGAQYIALASDGALYVADNGNFRIRKIMFARPACTAR